MNLMSRYAAVVAQAADSCRTLLDRPPGVENCSCPTKQSAEHLRAVNDILEIDGQLVREVRQRIFADVTEQAQDIHPAMISHYQDKLEGTNWGNVIRIRDGDDRVVVCVRRHSSVIQGLFLTVSDVEDLVLVSVVCQLTAENVKQLTNKPQELGCRLVLKR